MTDEAPTLGFGVTFDMVIADTACGQRLSLSSHRNRAENPPHRHVNDYVCVVLAGSFGERRTDGWRDRRPGTIFVHRAGETHHDRFGPLGAVCLSLHPSPNECEIPAIDGLCSTPARLAAGALAFELAANRREELVIASLAAEIMAAICLCDTGNDTDAWIDRVIQAISDEPMRRWSLRELASIAGRHPVHVAQAFRIRTGMSLGSFQRRRRLFGLCLALRGGRSSLAELASDFGYCDQSHMNSEFRAVFATSPGRYRRDFH